MRRAALAALLLVASGAGAATDGTWTIGMGQGIVEYVSTTPDGDRLTVACDRGNGRIGSSIWVEIDGASRDLGEADRVFEGTRDDPRAVTVGRPIPGGTTVPSVFRLVAANIAEHARVTVRLGAAAQAVFAIQGPADAFADCLP